ncbi:MAG: N-acetylmuramoyl-L-alanine amidase [Candidatus Eisenbacteria bacterium]|uniref:N-acetylmuramoyl-L-alanine amidase n=1 Tax=Eiseniibacteriota bacterium TaxID=2212470 RepID=A0A956LW44_UNCEI|nr:N-acetylmuramoyl-L-alanine amidase [Candidatus Eisenbacteria bacterium]
MSSTATAVTVTGVRSGDDASRTRLVLDLDGTAPEIDAPEHASDQVLTVGLPRYRLGPGVTAEIASVGRLIQGRFEDRGDDGIRLVLRPNRSCALRCFALESPPRLVIDVIDAPPEPHAGETSVAPRTDAEEAPAPAEAASPPTDELPDERTPIEAAPGPKRSGPRIVVIDAGHGGEDPGATGPGVREKDVCLDVARRLHKELAGREGIYPILTRSRDVLLPLRSRMALAEDADADLFVSIHVNAAATKNAQGAEVFFLSIRGASDEAAHEVAAYENEAGVAGDGDAQLSGSEIPFSLSLRQSDTLLRSSRAAEVVLDLLVERELARNRGVRQANFAVLRSYQVPSILVELGFVSSPIDRENLASADHRGRLAKALADGVVRYFSQYAPLRRGDEP